MQIRLRDAVEALKRELQDKGKSDPVFRLSKASITSRVVVKESETAKGGLEVFVIQAGAESTSDTEHAHEVTIEIEPLEEMVLGEH